MEAEFINLTEKNIDSEHLCCIIRSKVVHPGVETKRQWLAQRLKEGHVFRKLDEAKATVFIEYAPLETAWVPVEGENYLYLYCLWTSGEYRGKGYGRALLEQLDVLVDGPFVIAQKNLGLRFRGSSNQRILEVRPSLERGEPVLWDETSVE